MHAWRALCWLFPVTTLGHVWARIKPQRGLPELCRRPAGKRKPVWAAPGKRKPAALLQPTPRAQLSVPTALLSTQTFC